MSYYFYGTPLSSLERVMMEPPLTGRRGGGKTRFRYTKEMCDCTLCAVRPCPGINKCPCFDEYLEAGAWDYNQLLRRLNSGVEHGRLHERLRLLSLTPELNPWRDEAHRGRLLRLRRAGAIGNHCKSDYLAAMFLLTADKELWERCIFHIAAPRIYFQDISITGLDEPGYTLYQNAKDFYVSQPHIDEDWLSDPKETDDELFALLMAAFVIRAYGLMSFEEGGKA